MKRTLRPASRIHRATIPIAAVLFSLIGLVQAQPADAQLDHFTCYKIRPASGSTPFMQISGVSVVDGFRSSMVDVKNTKILCAPTNKNGEDPSAPSHPDHLKDYKIKTTKFPMVANQRIVDQFGTHFLDIKKPAALQVPTAKSLVAPPPPPAAPAVDHFQCYKVRTTKGTPKFVRVPGVTIEDQFGSMTIEVRKPFRLCAPANKNNEEPGAETHPDHLLCYKIRQTSLPKFDSTGSLYVNNQLGARTDVARRPTELCVPAARNPGATPTPTQTVVPTTPTRTPTPTSTSSAVTPTASRTATPTGPVVTLTPTPVPTNCVLPVPIPEVLSFVSRPGADLDTGWTGQAHDAFTVDDASLSAARLQGCDLNAASPTCGECGITGPIDFPGPAKNCFCYLLSSPDASTLTNCDPEAPACGGGETCTCFLGPPLALSSGGVPVCVVNRQVPPLTGTVNIADVGPNAGTGESVVRLVSSVHTGIDVARPCPTCEGDVTPRDGVRDGTCSGGAQDGDPCDVGGTHAFFGLSSFDCNPLFGANIGNLDIRFNPLTTGTTSLSTSGDVKCTAPGFTTLDCFCDTCATAAAEPCSSNADCPGVACGGRRCIGGGNVGAVCTVASQCPGGSCGRPGLATKPNDCDDAVCSPDLSDPSIPNDGVCEAGPFDTFCSIETFRGCSGDTECQPPPAGSCGTCLPGQVCTGDFRDCFLDPIVRSGVPGTQTATLAATFCIPPTSAPAVNSVGGLPGPGALQVSLAVFKGGAECGNGMIDAGETCDPPSGGSCPGECLPNCQCPVCGDDQVNQGTEECDGSDDSACPGQCQPDCTCSTSCGNNTIEFGEECDGTAVGGDCPPANCQPDCTCGPFCGNGAVDGSEECDGGAPGGDCPASACQPDCTCGPFCGNGIVDGGEQCDGTGVGFCPGTCEANCTCSPVCGDDMRQAGELCDGTDDSLCPGDCTGICTCPSNGRMTFVVQPGADLDTGWTGIAHDFAVQESSTISGELSNCDGMGDQVCDFFGNLGSFCSADPSRACLNNNQCSGAGNCVIQTFGPPLPLSAGGVPACIVNRFATDVTGTYNLQTGDSELFTTLNSLVHLGAAVRQPCPICDCGNPDPDTCQVGDPGTCQGITGNPPCTVEGVGPLGPTSNDCPPSSSLNVSGGGLVIPFNPVTTGTTTFPSNQFCDAGGFTSSMCWCDGQPQPNACFTACDGGSNNNLPCSSDAECPGAPTGACKPLCRQVVGENVGEGECVAGPVDQTCASAPEVSCQQNSDCPVGTGPCVNGQRRCFLDPIVRVGTPGTTSNVGAATFCIPATTATAINSTAGLPGPGSIVFPNAIDVRRCGDGIVNQPREECDGASAANCPGNCLANCTCNSICGNGTIEFGEQCDGAAGPCPGSCGTPGSAAECTCPPVCGDGFVGATEQCDPGGPGGVPPASDTACPGTCMAGSCQCPAPPPPSCGNGVIEGTEVCDLPAVGCGPLQTCLLCNQCFPPPDIIPPETGFICGNTQIEPTEACEIPAIGCNEGEICNPADCSACIDLGIGSVCGDLNITGNEVCELPAIGCPAGNTCLACTECVPTFPICGNLNFEPGEVCELPARGCGILQVCLLCMQCVP